MAQFPLTTLNYMQEGGSQHGRAVEIWRSQVHSRSGHTLKLFPDFNSLAALVSDQLLPPASWDCYKPCYFQFIKNNYFFVKFKFGPTSICAMNTADGEQRLFYYYNCTISQALIVPERIFIVSLVLSRDPLTAKHGEAVRRSAPKENPLWLRLGYTRHYLSGDPR